jgi:hypothetical protein
MGAMGHDLDTAIRAAIEDRHATLETDLLSGKRNIHDGVLYVAPGWRQRPIRRARLELRRLAYRRHSLRRAA